MEQPRSRRAAPWPLKRLIALWLVGAFVAFVICTAVIYFLYRRDGTAGSDAGLPGAIRAAMLIVGGAGGVVALVVAYRNQEVREAESERQSTFELTQRYAAATAQMSHESPAARLAGVYALAALADKWVDQRQQCIDVLCRYLRLPYDPDVADQGQREVRLAIIKVIASHLGADGGGWSGCDLDFEGVVFDGGDFSGARFSGNSRVIFDRARFKVSEGHVWFDSAAFTGREVSFDSAVFEEGSVRFEGALFNSLVRFDNAQFDGGTVNFRNANFQGGTVSFNGAKLVGRLTFEDATFEADCISFSNLECPTGRINFNGAKFRKGLVSLKDSYFQRAESYANGICVDGGRLDFDQMDTQQCKFFFDNAEFIKGTISFKGATLHSTAVSMAAGRFVAGLISYEGVTFDDSFVDISSPQEVSQSFSFILPSGDAALPIPTRMPAGES